ncbi:hypothetical protein SteCoe_11037 [Stentor coeruleus]|uniref:Uncharacterized protein n=1 Tax=Stentor coeruleus TaxID=5963 RepID=A0A1R2CE37_9CILI|nr:hypothetical protein SteCoe_11037 [Stentor coeruleus]
MDKNALGISGEDAADALFGEIDLEELSNDVIINSLLETPENMKEFLTGKDFPMSKEQVLDLFREFETEGLISQGFSIKNLSDGEYSIDQVTEMLKLTFTRILQQE